MNAATADPPAHAAGSAAGSAVPEAQRKPHGSWRVLIRAAVGVSLLGLAVTQADAGELSITWGAHTAIGISCAVLLLVLAQVQSALRWRTILGPEAPPWRFLFRLYLVGQFFSLFLPTSIGGDAVRAAAVARALPRAGAGISSVVLDRLFGVGALGAYLLLGAAVSPWVLSEIAAELHWNVPGWTLWLVPVGGVAVVASLRLLARKLDGFRRMLQDAWHSTAHLMRAPRALLRAAGLALLVQGTYIVTWAILARALALPVPLALLAVAVPLVSLVAMLPITLSGLGLREGAWVLLLSPLGISVADAVAYSLLYFLAFSLVSVIGGVAFAAWGTGWSRVTPSLK